MSKKKTWIKNILILCFLILLSHFLYREVKIQECMCGVIIETFDCDKNDLQCQKEVENEVEEYKLECKRESINCSFLFNCEC